MTTRWIYTGAALLALIVTGLVHGYWTDRWAHSQDTADAAELLQAIPLNIGDWHGTEISVKPGQAGDGVTGCMQRRYFHVNRGVEVVMAMVNGRPGPVAIHTPDVCYGANGYLVGKPNAVHLDNQKVPAHFWKSDAVRTKAYGDESKLRIYWGWSAGEGWYAATEARHQFPRHRYPILHKLYVLRDLHATDNGKDEACEAFLQVLLPVLEKTLFQPRS